jgi:hypothetical protein
MRNRPFRDEFQRHVERFGHDMEEASDKVRRGMARELRSLAPDLMRAGQSAAKDLWYRAEHIDQSLLREGKRPSTQPRLPAPPPVARPAMRQQPTTTRQPVPRPRMTTQRGY